MNSQTIFDTIAGDAAIRLTQNRLKMYLSSCEIYWIEAKWYAEEKAQARFGRIFNTKIDIARCFKYLADTFIEKNEELTKELKK